MDFANLYLPEVINTSFPYNRYYRFLVSELPQEVLFDLPPESTLITFNPVTLMKVIKQLYDLRGLADFTKRILGKVGRAGGKLILTARTTVTLTI
jgi:hypothetical protein